MIRDNHFPASKAHHWLHQAAECLREKGQQRPWQTARVLLSMVSQQSQEYIIAYPEKIIFDANKANAMLQRCLQGEPISRIQGYREFYGRNFMINPHVLDPRPESELLIDQALRLFPHDWAGRVLEIGVGSGALLISLALERPYCQLVGTDISIKALGCAKANIKAYGLQPRIQLEKASWFPQSINQKPLFDLIYANPPYIETGLLASLDKNVRDYDPSLALDGGVDGLDAYRAIAQGLTDFCHANTMILFEIGMGQQDAIAAIMHQAGFALQGVEHDLASIPRIMQFSSN